MKLPRYSVSFILALDSVSGQKNRTWCSGQHPIGGQHAPLPEAGEDRVGASHAPLWNAKYKQGMWFMSVDTEYYRQLTRKCLFMSGPGSLFTSLIEARWQQSFWRELLLCLQEPTPHIRCQPVPRKLYSAPPIPLPPGSPTPPPTHRHAHTTTHSCAHTNKSSLEESLHNMRHTLDLKYVVCFQGTTTVSLNLYV